MESFLSFFQDIPSSYRSFILASGLLFFWIVEGLFPLFRFSYRRYRHAALNLVFTLTTLVVNFSLAFLIVNTADLATTFEFGAMNLLPSPLWLSVLIGVLVLDLIGAWLIHVIEHKVRWMWKFHLIHHTDTSIDVTTALRHHPGESVFRAAFTMIAILAAGAPIGVVFIYQTASALLSQFNHANIRLPKQLDRALSWVIVSPDMHKVHHHYTQPLTDTNYGNIFAFWDRVFRTFAEVKNNSDLIYGIDTHMNPEENDELGNLMAIPFQKYRPAQGSKFSGHWFVSGIGGLLMLTANKAPRAPMLALNILVSLVTGYIVVGIILAPIFSFTQIHKIDPAARGASLGFRLIVLPGLAMLWPLIALRVVRGASPPTEKTAHKELWGDKP